MGYLYLSKLVFQALCKLKYYIKALLLVLVIILHWINILMIIMVAKAMTVYASSVFIS